MGLNLSRSVLELMICAFNVMLLICLRIHRRSSVKNVQNQGRVLPYTHIILTSEFCPVGRFLQVCLRILPPTHVRRSHLRISSLSAVWKCRSKMRPMEGKVVVVHTSRVNEHSTDKRLGQAYHMVQSRVLVRIKKIISGDISGDICRQPRQNCVHLSL